MSLGVIASIRCSFGTAILQYDYIADQEKILGRGMTVVVIRKYDDDVFATTNCDVQSF